MLSIHLIFTLMYQLYYFFKYFTFPYFHILFIFLIIVIVIFQIDFLIAHAKFEVPYFPIFVN